ncbi:MAG: hypothetical protein HUU21_27930 [Polyangiaceae bacterium]|nr:hypothetical protein [Polyangiaceae bacterium]NUQ77384.1 hypothetical protein [Polyangiaceae bacterium]
MLDKLVCMLEASARGRNIAITGGFYAIFVMILQVGGSKIEEVAGSDAILDLRKHFTEAEAYAVLSRYGDQGRSLYIRLEFVDFFYPLAYGTLIALVLAFVLSRAFSPASSIRRLALLPVAAVGLDYLENIGLITMAATFPERWPRLGTVTGLFNAAKWIVVAMCLAVAVMGLFFWLVQTIRRRREA